MWSAIQSDSVRLAAIAGVIATRRKPGKFRANLRVPRRARAHRVPRQPGMDLDEVGYAWRWSEGIMTKEFKTITLSAVLLLVGGIASTGAWSGSASRTTYITFSQAVALPGVELSAGTYVFEVANPSSASNTVRVSSRDRSKVYLQAFTNSIQRPEGLAADRVITMGEAPRGAASPIQAWFPAGDSIGHEFIYRH